jgi:hypothetical protein
MDEGLTQQRLKEEAEQRTKEREIKQTKVVRCSLIHGSRIGLRASKVGYGLGIALDGGHLIVQRLVGVQYEAPPTVADGLEASPTEQLSPLQVGDRLVKVGDTLVTDHQTAVDAVKAFGEKAEMLELTVMRDPAQTPGKLMLRDRLWNYSHPLYWMAFWSLWTSFAVLLVGFGYRLSQIEMPEDKEGYMYPPRYPRGRYPRVEL